MVEDFWDRGWLRFPFDPQIEAWLRHAEPAARGAVADPENTGWLDCEGTWFVGVDALNNDSDGCIDGSDALSGQAVSFIKAHLGWLPLHKAQISVTYPGYPRPRRGETEAASRPVDRR